MAGKKERRHPSLLQRDATCHPLTIPHVFSPPTPIHRFTAIEGRTHHDLCSGCGSTISRLPRTTLGRLPRIIKFTLRLTQGKRSTSTMPFTFFSPFAASPALDVNDARPRIPLCYRVCSQPTPPPPLPPLLPQCLPALSTSVVVHCAVV
jgi:hypothetical protein